MKRRVKQKGFTLIEVIFFIVVVGIAMAGITPLYMQVLSGLHVLNEGMQAEFLGREMSESLRAAYGKDGSGFVNLTQANFPSQTGIDLGSGFQFDRTVEVQGMIPGQLPDPCTGQPYNGESFKCLTVTVKASGSGEILFQERMVNTDLLN